jgi:hypothetical protein
MTEEVKTHQEQEKQAIINATKSSVSYEEINGKFIIHSSLNLELFADTILQSLSELRKPSEDLVQEITKIATRIIQSDCGIATCVSCESEQYAALDYDFAEVTAKEIATEIAALLSSSRCQENEAVSKTEMFDFVRWLREADRFNGGQSLKIVYEQFKNK